MLGRIVGGAVIGAVLLFLVGFIWWGLPVGPGAAATSRAPDEAAFQAALAEHLPDSGTYIVPMMGGEDDADAWVERHRKGPLAIVILHRGGKEPMDPVVMVLGFLHGLVSCLLAAGLVAGVGAGRSFVGRWGIVIFLGLFLVVFENLSGLVWWSEPPEWFAATASYNLVGWFVAGLPIAALVKRSD